MEKISYNLVFNRKKRLNKKRDGIGAGGSLSEQEKRCISPPKYISKPDQWDAKRKMVKSHPNAECFATACYMNI